MKLKSLTNAFATLAVLAILVTILAPGSGRRPERAGEAVVEPEQIRGAVRIVLREAGREPILMMRKGQHWKLGGSDPLPVDSERLTSLFGNLLDLKYERFVTSKQETLDRINLDASSIVIGTNEEPEKFKLRKGKDAPGGFYFALGDDQEAWQAEGSLSLNSLIYSWISREPIPWTSEEVVSIATPFEVAGAPLSFVRADAGETFKGEAMRKGEEPRSEVVAKLASDIVPLRFTNYEPKDAEAVVEAMKFAKTWSVTSKDGETITFSIGRTPERTEPPAEGDEGGEPKTVPAGTAYVTFESSTRNSPWTQAFDKFAFEVSSFYFEQLPTAREELVIDGLKAATPEPEAPASAE